MLVLGGGPNGGAIAGPPWLAPVVGVSTIAVGGDVMFGRRTDPRTVAADAGMPVFPAREASICGFNSGNVADTAWSTSRPEPGTASTVATPMV
jgi:hypothetical protein